MNINEKLQQIVNKIINSESPSNSDEDDFLPQNTSDRNRINFIYLKKVLDLINDSVDNFVKMYGKDMALAAIQSVINGEINPIVNRIMEDHFSELQPTIPGIYEYEDLESYLAKASTKELERFLLLIGVSPMYAPLLRKYFGDYGALTIYSMLEAAATGQLDRDLIINSLIEQTYEQEK